MHLVALVCLMGADYSLDLTANRTEIHRCDHLVIKAVITNHSKFLAPIDPRPGHVNSIAFERRFGNSWVEIPGMSFRRLRGFPLPEAPLLDTSATYAEYNTIFLDDDDEFVFSQPGKVELRAVAKVSSQRVESAPLVVTVKPRHSNTIKRITRAKQSVSYLGSCWLPEQIPDDLLTLRDASGNIGEGIKNVGTIKRVVSGEEKTGGDVIGYIRKQMDSVNAEVGLVALGNHYFRTRDYLNLAKVVEALPDHSRFTREWTASLEFQKLKTIPKVVVPPGNNSP